MLFSLHMDAKTAANSAWIIFTDLDGTLLDHQSYTPGPARTTLVRLSKDRVPIIPVSSKTGPELVHWQQDLGLSGPMITENGAAIHFPADWTGAEPNILRFSPTYPELIKHLRALRDAQGYGFSGFADLGVEGVMEQTGLDRNQSELACTREGSEPILWQDSEVALADFQQQLDGLGLRTIMGGRFLHILGRKAGKAEALSLIIETLRELGWQGQSMALGDAPNDHGMLCAVDLPVHVRNPHAVIMPPINNPRLYRTEKPGPMGWREAVDQFIPAT